MNEIHAIHDNLDDSYGSPSLTNDLATRGFCANLKRVERLVSAYGLYATDARRKKVRTTVPDLWAAPLPDLVRRDFSVGVPGRRTCGDITYIRTNEDWLYLASVLDLASRRVASPRVASPRLASPRLVGYIVESHMRTELVSRALTMAIDARWHDVTGMIFHQLNSHSSRA